MSAKFPRVGGSKPILSHPSTTYRGPALSGVLTESTGSDHVLHYDVLLTVVQRCQDLLTDSSESDHVLHYDVPLTVFQRCQDLLTESSGSDHVPN